MIQFHLRLRTNRSSFEAKPAEETYIDSILQTNNVRGVDDADLRLRFTNADANLNAQPGAYCTADG